jgi:ATP-dependent DNA ligase
MRRRSSKTTGTTTLLPQLAPAQAMFLLRTEKLPQGGLWVYEPKLDGFRAEAIKSVGSVHLRSRNDKDFNAKYPAIVEAPAAMPDETVIDGEIVALDESSRQQGWYSPRTKSVLPRNLSPRNGRYFTVWTLL